MKLSTSLILSLYPVASQAASGYFSYDPENSFGPVSWAAVDVPGNQCGGSKQSGIDVPIKDCEVYDDYIFSAGSCTLDDLEYVLYPHVIQANYITDNCEPPRMYIPGQPLPFDALQFHLHTGTDHAIGGTYFGADMHLVHKEVGGDRYAVLGFFIEPTSPSGIPKFRDLLVEFEAVSSATKATCAAAGNNGSANSTETVIPQGAGRKLAERMRAEQRKLQAQKENAERKLPRSFNPYDLVPADSTMYTYDGSLTTPPCSEVVFWNVVDNPVSVSVREFMRLTNLILDYVSPETCTLATNAAPSGFTGRPVQAINGRTITRICPSDSEPPAVAETPTDTESEPETPAADETEPESSPVSTNGTASKSSASSTFIGVSTIVAAVVAALL